MYSMSSVPTRAYLPSKPESGIAPVLWILVALVALTALAANAGRISDAVTGNKSGHYTVVLTDRASAGTMDAADLQQIGMAVEKEITGDTHAFVGTMGAKDAESLLSDPRVAYVALDETNETRTSRLANTLDDIGLARLTQLEMPEIKIWKGQLNEPLMPPTWDHTGGVA